MKLRVFLILFFACMFAPFSTNAQNTPVPIGTFPVLGEQKTLVILYTYQDTPNDKPFTKEYVADRFFGTNNSLSSTYREHSYGKTWYAGVVTDWIVASWDSKPGCSINYGFLQQKAQEQGILLSDFTRLVYINSYNPTCSVSASIGGFPSEIILNSSPIGTIDIYSLVHESGHNLTLGHAHSLSCGGKSIDTYANCTKTYYGDLYNYMGHRSGAYFQAYQKYHLGWIDDSQLMTVTQSGRYILKDSSQPNGTIGLKVKKPDTDEYYYLDYFPALQVNGEQGVQVRIGYYFPYSTNNTSYAAPESYLLDMHPATSSFDDAMLSDGEQFNDGLNAITITQVSHSDAEVTLDVVLPSTSCIPGDVDCQNGVSLTDLIILLSYFGRSDSIDPRADFNHDGRITLLDLSTLLSNFGKN